MAPQDHGLHQDGGSPTWTCVVEPAIDMALDRAREPNEIKVDVEMPAEKVPEEGEGKEAAEGAGGGSALAEGGEVNILELGNIGFILQYFAVGVIYGGLPSTVYGFFLGYLSVPGYIYATASVVTSLPWSFKFFFGLMNDCMPIGGYRRKPYMVFGWALCFSILVLLSQKSLPDPYWCRDEAGNYLKKQDPCNPEARDHGGEFAMLMCLAALGYVIADVAADGLMVQYARREPEHKRGGTQTMVYMVRSFGMIGSVALVGVGMNGKEYNGTFDHSLSFNTIMGIFAVPAGIMVPVSWFLVKEDKVKPEQVVALCDYAKSAWNLLTSKAMFYIVLYQFFEPFIGRISTTAGGLVKSEWAGVKNLQNNIFSLVSLCVFSFGLWQVKKRFLNFSWRMILATTAIFINVTDFILAFCTIFDVVRNQYFYLGENVLDELPAAANFVVGTFIVVEMADHGNEGLTYGLLTTIANLGSPFSRAVGNQIFGFFTPNLSETKNYVEDSQEFREVVAWSFALSYCFSFASLLFLFLIPNQKAEAQQRKKDWSRKQLYAYITVALLVFALTYSLIVNFLTMFPETACLRLVGGQGCNVEGE